MLHRVSTPKIPPTPSLSSPLLRPPPPPRALYLKPRVRALPLLPWEGLTCAFAELTFISPRPPPLNRPSAPQSPPPPPAALRLQPST